jgi:hypothetical protein
MQPIILSLQILTNIKSHQIVTGSTGFASQFCCELMPCRFLMANLGRIGYKN